jgi:hypothetical protein
VFEHCRRQVGVMMLYGNALAIALAGKSCRKVTGMLIGDEEGSLDLIQPLKTFELADKSFPARDAA